MRGANFFCVSCAPCRCFRHSHGGTGCAISPQAFLRFSCFLLQPFQHRIPWRIFPIPPTPAIFDQLMVDVGAIRQEHIGKGAAAMRREMDQGTFSFLRLHCQQEGKLCPPVIDARTSGIFVFASSRAAFRTLARSAEVSTSERPGAEVRCVVTLGSSAAKIAAKSAHSAGPMSRRTPLAPSPRRFFS